MNYNKNVMKNAICNPKAQAIYSAGRDKEKREWNRHVAGYILDEFLSKMEGEDAMEFIQYANVLTYISVGMFDSSVQYIETAILPNIQSETLKENARFLVGMLRESDNFPKS